MNVVELYADDPREWLAARGLWAGTHSYNDEAKRYVADSGHYLEAPPPGALLGVTLEPLTTGLFGPVASGVIAGIAVLGRPVARNLPQKGTWAELTRFVLDRGLPEHTASHLLRVAVEIWFSRPMAATMITYHDRTRHSGCIYKKAGFRKFGVTRPGTRRGTWASRPGRERGASSEEPSKRRWRIDAEDVRAGLAMRSLLRPTAIRDVM